MPGAALALFTWSAFTWAFSPPLQNILLELRSGDGLLLSLNASAIYLGAGISGVVGGLVITTAGVRALPPTAALLGLLAFALLLKLRRWSPTQRTCMQSLRPVRAPYDGDGRRDVPSPRPSPSPPE